MSRGCTAENPTLLAASRCRGGESANVASGRSSSHRLTCSSIGVAAMSASERGYIRIGRKWISFPW